MSQPGILCRSSVNRFLTPWAERRRQCGSEPLHKKKNHTADRASNTAAKYTISAQETNSAAAPTHTSASDTTLGTVLGTSSSRSTARRTASYKGCGMNLLSILIAWTHRHQKTFENH
jgi:hypothetical protein